MESKVFEVIVVGAGVMGSATAYFLSKTLGGNVLLLEQFDRLHSRGSSHGSSRYVQIPLLTFHWEIARDESVSNQLFTCCLLTGLSE